MKWSSFKYLFGQGVHSLSSHSMMTFASIGVLTVCMILTGIAYLFSANVDSLIEYLGSQNETVVYLNTELTEDETAAVDSAVRSIKGVSGVKYMSKEDVLETYKGYMEEQYVELWDAFDNDNPFKANYRVAVEDLSEIERVSAELAAIEGVDSVSAPLAMSNVFLQVQKVVNYAGYGLVAILTLVAMVVISNTIRISVFARRKEINIMKFVGATNGFIRFPFLVEGVMAGLISALIACVVVLGGYWLLTYYSDLVPGFWRSLLSESVVPVSAVWYKIVPAFAVFAVVMGGLGSLSSMRRYLDV